MNKSGRATKRKGRFWIEFRRQLPRQLMTLPGIVFLLIFAYYPMYGVIIAFKKYMPSKGIWGSPWIGLEHFETLFKSPLIFSALGNTLTISILSLLIVFPAPIIFALMLNEIRGTRFKKTIQTVSYLPYFISWVIVVGIIYTFLEKDGLINNILLATGLIEKPISYLSEGKYFYAIVILSDLWKGLGWGSIIYLAAITGISPELYEAAIIDGATKLKQVRHITLPSIKETIVILLIFRISAVLNSNFDQIYLLQNDSILNVAETIDTYVFKQGINRGLYSFATAAALTKSVISFGLLMLANLASKKVSDTGVI